MACPVVRRRQAALSTIVRRVSLNREIPIPLANGTGTEGWKAERERDIVSILRVHAFESLGILTKGIHHAPVAEGEGIVCRGP